MAVDLYVQRGDGGNEAPHIVDPMLTTVDVALSRGATEIEEYAHKVLTRLDIVARPGLRRGVVVRVLDSLQGIPWYGKIHAIDIKQQGVECTASLEVYRLR
jgi:hypothetical protein